MRKFLNQITPFFLIGFAIVAFSFGIILLAYLFFFGAIFGFILYAVSWIRQKFVKPKPPQQPTAKSGRIIDSDDWKKL